LNATDARKLRPSRIPFVPLPRLLALVLLTAVPLGLATFYEPLAWAAVAIGAIAIVLAVVDARATRALTAEDVTREIADQPTLRAPHPVKLTVRTRSSEVWPSRSGTSPRRLSTSIAGQFAWTFRRARRRAPSTRRGRGIAARSGSETCTRDSPARLGLWSVAVASRQRWM
jgi:hypothetical protein